MTAALPIANEAEAPSPKNPPICAEMGGSTFTQALKCLKLKLLRAILAEHVEGPDGQMHGSHRVGTQLTPNTLGIFTVSSKTVRSVLQRRLGRVAAFGRFGSDPLPRCCSTDFSCVF